MPFKEPIALLALLSAIPLIIIYLIRPKPKDHPFSSIMFIDPSEAEKSLAISRFISDPLFWLQLLILILLATAAAGPYMNAPGNPGTHLVVVLDVSASMEKGLPQAATAAYESTASMDRLSLVLGKARPEVVVREANADSFLAAFASQKSVAVSADLSSAMMMAQSLLGPEGGNILVISDFISWSGDDPESTRKVIESGGPKVVFKKVGSTGENVGIVGGWIEEGAMGLNYTCRIHNYGRARSVLVSLQGPGGSASSTAYIGDDKDYYFTFVAPPGASTVSLDVQDFISSDDKAYIYTPEVRERSILYLGNDSPALYALLSLPNLTVVRDGQPQGKDLVVVLNGSSDGRINRYVTSGGGVVYLATGGNVSPDYIPVTIKGEIKGREILWARMPGFAAGIHFEEIGIKKYPYAVPRQGSVTMVEANSIPVLSIWSLGRGKVIYSALDMTDFYMKPEYPIFWLKAVNYLTGVPDAREANRRTGEVLPLGKSVDVKTPAGQMETSSLLMEHVGIYEFEDKTVAANMYDPRESDPSGAVSLREGAFGLQTGITKPMEQDLSVYLIALAGLLVIAELAIVRRRREI
jgi:hypothetical protein